MNLGVMGMKAAYWIVHTLDLDGQTAGTEMMPVSFAHVSNHLDCTHSLDKADS